MPCVCRCVSCVGTVSAPPAMQMHWLCLVILSLCPSALHFTSPRLVFEIVVQTTSVFYICHILRARRKANCLHNVFVDVMSINPVWTDAAPWQQTWRLLSHVVSSPLSSCFAFPTPQDEEKAALPALKKPGKVRPLLGREKSAESPSTSSSASAEKQRQEARKRLLAAKKAASFRQNSATESADSIEIYVPEAQTRLWENRWWRRKRLALQTRWWRSGRADRRHNPRWDGNMG